MAMPALRQPKVILQERSKTLENFIRADVKNVIITLKGNKSLVIPWDSYHGIIMGRDTFRCVFCRADLEPDVKMKEIHMNSDKHRSIVESYPHIEDYSFNLIRKLDIDNYYCTLCNVIVTYSFLTRHITTEVHRLELEKAGLRFGSILE